MYCVIQEIETKRTNKHGWPKELISYYSEMSFNGVDISHYSHHYSQERFERPIKKAYKISIHKSSREDGQVKKLQFSIGTINFYELADGNYFSLYDFYNSKICKVADILNVDPEVIYVAIENKLQLFKKRAEEEFEQTEEYKTHQEHECITTEYALAKMQFNTKYGFDGTSYEYDKCYDVFGNLQNAEYLKKIEADFKAKQEYGRRSRENGRSYYEDYSSNYSKYSSNGSYSNSISSNHNTEDKETLKQFYRVLSKKFHPDAVNDVLIL